ncbi:MAG: hypothetical protein H0X17_11465 [Deltaproteobacteria bacterium]|nr:hypothetical protein [Deltaproteobacteria bacterium]
MSEPTVLVNFRLDRDTPVRVRWLATDGTPLDGYKAQITAVVLPDGTRFAMHGSSIIEQTQPDPSGADGAYVMTFNGMIGYATDHPDRPHVDQLLAETVDYELEFVRDDGQRAVAGRDYEIVESPRGMARKISHRDA